MLDTVRERDALADDVARLDDMFRFADDPLHDLDPGTFRERFEGLVREFGEGRSKLAHMDFGGDVRLMSRIAAALQEAGSGLPEPVPWQEGPRGTWEDACFYACDLLREILSRKDDISKRAIDRHGDSIFGFLRLLLGGASPFRKAGRMPSKTGESRLLSWEERAMSVRTVATETLAFLMFRECDAGTGEAAGISPRIKDLLGECVSLETSPESLFKLGHFFSDCHALDREWALGLLDRLFPEDPDRRTLYVGAWTGFLSNAMSADQFFAPEFQGLYGRALGLRTKPEERVFPRYQFEPELGLANHLSIAFVEFDRFGFDHSLLRQFRESATQEQMRQFVKLTGRQIRGDSDRVSNLAKERLLNFWRWLLMEWEDASPFLELGGWINTRTGIFPPAELAGLALQTLRKTSGELTWYHGLNKSIPELAVASPENAVEIVRLFLHGSAVVEHSREVALTVGSGWQDAARRLAGHGAVGPDARALLAEMEGHWGRAG